MNITEFKSILAANPGKPVRFMFADNGLIPAHYHVTEVGHVRKDFIDCGGTLRSTAACVLQTWVHDDDQDHRLDSTKLLAIISLAETHFPIHDLDVEVEYEEETISQFPVGCVESTADAIIFHLTTKHTDCLAREKCGIENSCCSDSRCC